MTERGIPRHHLVILGFLTLFAVARGTYWAVTLEIWSPSDEAQHVDYVDSLATGRGIPTVGRDLLTDDIMSIAKTSPTYFARSRPFLSQASDPHWGSSAQQYEGIQGPVYYALMVPAYWLGSTISPLAAAYAVRLASVLLAALAVPLAWALGRRLLPERPLAWLLGPALLVCVNGFMATAATAGNDTIVVTGTALALLLAARAASSSKLAPAIFAGVVAGLVFVGKTTALGLFPLMAVLVLVQHRAGNATTHRWFARVLAAGAGALAVTVPWIAWNLVTYKAISGAHAAEAITGDLQTTLEPGLDALRRHWIGARNGFWEGGLLTGEASYHQTWDVVAVLLGATGLVAALRRWRRHEAETVAALALSFPIAFATMVSFLFLVLGGSGLLLGRYLYVALVPLLLGLGAAALALAGERLAPVLVLGICSLVLWKEIGLTDHYLTTTYERVSAVDGVTIDPDLAPVVDQDWNDGLVRARAVVVDAGCPVEVLQVGFERPPITLLVHAADGTVSARRVGFFPTGFATYELDTPASGSMRIDVPAGTGVAVSATEREPRASLDGGTTDPLVRAWCDVGAPRAAVTRFERTYDPQHPNLSRSALRAWPRAWFCLALALTVTAAAIASRRKRATAPR